MNHWDGWHVKFCMEIISVYLYCVWNILCKVTVINMVTMRYFEFVSDKFNVVEIRISGNYAQKWSQICTIIRLYFLLASECRFSHLNWSRRLRSSQMFIMVCWRLRCNSLLRRCILYPVGTVPSLGMTCVTSAQRWTDVCLCNVEAQQRVDQYAVHLTPCTGRNHNNHHPTSYTPVEPSSYFFRQISGGCKCVRII